MTSEEILKMLDEGKHPMDIASEAHQAIAKNSKQTSSHIELQLSDQVAAYNGILTGILTTLWLKK